MPTKEGFDVLSAKTTSDEMSLLLVPWCSVKSGHTYGGISCKKLTDSKAVTGL